MYTHKPAYMEKAMTQETRDLQMAAETARHKLRLGLITYEEARKIVGAYGECFNKRAAELAKEHGMRAPKKFSITAYLR